MFRYLKASLLVATTSFAITGCGSDADRPPREPISGKVTLGGRPLKKGFVTFVPTAGNPDIVVSALVIDGEYTLSREEGPTRGPHRVGIWSREATGKVIKDRNDPENPVAVTREVVPSQYNVNSQLIAEVKPDGDNRFDFDLATTKVAMKSKR